MSSIKSKQSSQSQKPKDGKSFNKTQNKSKETVVPKWASIVQENINYVAKLKHFPTEMIGISFMYAEPRDQSNPHKGYRPMVGKFMYITEDQLNRVLEVVESPKSGIEKFISKQDNEETTDIQNDDADNDNENESNQ